MLWIAQVSLAVIFLFAGGVKLVLPLEAMASPVALPGPFIRFLGVVEVAGALGLVLPDLLGIRRALTRLAAAGLVVMAGLVLIMTGATVITVSTGQVAPALFPLAVGLLCALVAYRRRRRAPSFQSSPTVLQPAR